MVASDICYDPLGIILKKSSTTNLDKVILYFAECSGTNPLESGIDIVNENYDELRTKIYDKLYGAYNREYHTHMCIYLYVCMCVYIYICVYVCLSVCICVRTGFLSAV